jgi:hypothetical protein
MKNIFKIERDEKGVAKWDTFNQRFAFAANVIGFLILTPLVVLTFAWFFYWLITGKNIFNLFID